MKDTAIFKVMGALQFMIAFINFYVAQQAAQELSTLNLAMAAICTLAGVFCTVAGCKMFGWLDN